MKPLKLKKISLKALRNFDHIVFLKKVAILNFAATKVKTLNIRTDITVLLLNFQHIKHLFKAGWFRFSGMEGEGVKRAEWARK